MTALQVLYLAGLVGLVVLIWASFKFESVGIAVITTVASVCWVGVVCLCVWFLVRIFIALGDG